MPQCELLELFRVFMVVIANDLTSVFLVCDIVESGKGSARYLTNLVIWDQKVFLNVIQM